MNSICGKELFYWYRQTKQAAIANNIDPDEVDWLLRTFTCLGSLSLRLGSWEGDTSIESQKSLQELEHLWQSRLQKRLPVQYLAETVFWRRFQLKVTPAVLIPRPETELIIDIVQSAVAQGRFTARLKLQSQHLQSQHWVDLGTGSGAIALGLADILPDMFPQAVIHAVDLSLDALNVARENAKNLGLEQHISFYQGSWWSPLEFLKGQVIGMISNPPYIPSSQIPQLQPEVVNHEPISALDGGEDGLDDIRYLIATAPEYLVSGGIWLIELMTGQSDLIVELLRQQGQYYDVKVFSDLNDIERFVLAYRR